MHRDQMILAMAGALFGAVLIGWVLHWIFSRANGVSGPRNARRTADLAHRLHAAEEAQHRAEARLREVEVDLRQRNVDLQSELAAVQQTLERERVAGEDLRTAYRQAMTERGTGAAG